MLFYEILNNILPQTWTRSGSPLLSVCSCVCARAWLLLMIIKPQSLSHRSEPFTTHLHISHNSLEQCRKRIVLGSVRDSKVFPPVSFIIILKNSSAIQAHTE